MKKYFTYAAVLFGCMSLSGCGIMEMSFKAGFIMALVIAAVVGLLIWVFHIGRVVIRKYFPAINLIFEGFWDE